MKRRTFLKNSSLGLSAALVTGAASGGLMKADDGRRRVYGVPDSVRPRPPLAHDLLRLSLGRTDLPPEAWQEIAALAILAQDVFDDPRVAESFTRDPAAYLSAAGMPHVSLDPEAIETRIALALGDPEVRAAIAREDAAGFVRLLEQRGLVATPEPSILARRIGAQIESLKQGLDPAPSPEACMLVILCAAAVWVWVAVVQDVVAAVAVAAVISIYAYTLVYTGTVGPDDPKRRMKASSIVADQPPFRLASALGGRDFGERAADAWVEENVETIAAAVESLQAYRDSGAADAPGLRAALRAQMHRQLGGRAITLEPART